MSRWIPNAAAEAELRRDPGIHAQVVSAARSAERIARVSAPRTSGSYAGSIFVDNDGERVVLASNDPGAVWIEVGSVNNPAFAPLRRGVRAAGLRLDESR